ncbi:MAG: NAD(P)-dependent oxidoreductase [Verrucomicrobiota bacterium]
MKICLVGLGIIGCAWAPHYHQIGYDLSLWNRTPKDLKGYEPNLKKAVSAAETIHIVVADPPAVEGVLDQIIEVVDKHALIIQSSTISGEWARKFSDKVQALGTSYVEAPFTGSKIAAEEGANIFFLGGEGKAKEKARQVLAPIAKNCFDVGSVEQACGIKLAMNIQIAMISQALNEGLSFARKSGIEDELFFKVLSENVAQSGVAKLKMPKLTKNDYTPQFSIKHMHKDIKLALSSGGDSLLPLTKCNEELYAKGVSQGLQDKDFSALIQLLREN